MLGLTQHLNDAHLVKQGTWILLLSVLVLTPSPAWSGEIILPSQALDRDTRVQARYRAQSAGTGKGQLTVTWTDVYDRLIEQRRIPFELRDTSEGSNRER